MESEATGEYPVPEQFTDELTHQKIVKEPSEQAIEAARVCCNYCLTRFPCDTPPHETIDLPWFAEVIQKAIDEWCSENLR